MAEHGGGIDRACAVYGGTRAEWLDLSTGINPRPYPLPPLDPTCWQTLPDLAAQENLEQAARAFWDVPPEKEVIATPGASAAIAALPSLWSQGRIAIPEPTYNEHRAAFAALGWTVIEEFAPDAAALMVHPNNPDGRLWPDLPDAAPVIIDESFCDICPEHSHICNPTPVILKSFGKFWGLAGLRLGFVITPRQWAAPLRSRLGPWAVSGPALSIGSAALRDRLWAAETRARLAADAAQLDALLVRAGMQIIGGTTLFRLYEGDAARLHERLCRAQILTRVFSYAPHWIRFGLPGTEQDWQRLAKALTGS